MLAANLLSLFQILNSNKYQLDPMTLFYFVINCAVIIESEKKINKNKDVTWKI